MKLALVVFIFKNNLPIKAKASDHPADHAHYIGYSNRCPQLANDSEHAGIDNEG